MAQIRLDMMARRQPRSTSVGFASRELESEIARLRAEVAVISPTLDKYHSLHAPIRRLPPGIAPIRIRPPRIRSDAAQRWTHRGFSPESVHRGAILSRIRRRCGRQ